MTRILVVRLGAMGDVIHTLPAAASLSLIPDAHVTWIVDPKWAVLLEANPTIDSIIPFDRHDWRSFRQIWSRLREKRFDLAVDFQGLIKSAIVARVSGAEGLYGYARPRERSAALLYSHRAKPVATHVVEQHLELALLAGAPRRATEFTLPRGDEDGTLPSGEFVLANPLAGWKAKQWPLEYYTHLAQHVNLVVNGAPSARAELEQVRGAHIHLSGIGGLIHATRRARAVVGVDSGPLHLAAALGKPGVAIFGPTDPARNGPYGGSLRVLRARDAETTYKRGGEISGSMRSVTPEQVLEALA
jgi:heptosyltransferase-1